MDFQPVGIGKPRGFGEDGCGMRLGRTLGGTIADRFISPDQDHVLGALRDRGGQQNRAVRGQIGVGDVAVEDLTAQVF